MTKRERPASRDERRGALPLEACCHHSRHVAINVMRDVPRVITPRTCGCYSRCGPLRPPSGAQRKGNSWVLCYDSGGAAVLLYFFCLKTPVARVHVFRCRCQLPPYITPLCYTELGEIMVIMMSWAC